MERTPIYIVTGFLSTGKTTVMNYLLKRRYGKKICVVQMEEGMTAPQQDCVVTLPMLTKDTAKEIAYRLRNCVTAHAVSEVWLEWNGMVPFQRLEELFLQTNLSRYYVIKKIFFVTTPSFCLTMLGKTGDAVYSQLLNADTIFLLDSIPPQSAAPEKTEEIHKARRLLKTICPETHSVNVSHISLDNAASIYKGASRPSGILFMGLALLMTVLYGFFAVSADPAYAAIRVVLTFWMATVLQAFPFLLLGILCSSALQLFISPACIERYLSGSLVKRMAYALAGGFVFPVCDCAAIPVFRGLIGRRVPIPAAMLFMLAGPIVNPVVILSTYYAFAGNWEVVIGRVALGTIAAIGISLTFKNYHGLEELTASGQLPINLCGYTAFPAVSEKNVYGKALRFLIHSQREFFRMAPYVLLGALLASLFQIYGGSILQFYSLQSNLFAAIELMIVFAFFISLCSTADAVIAKNLSSHILMPGIMAFLLFGPMMDLKNFLLLSSLFPREFVYRLVVTIIIACCIAAFIFAVVTGSVGV
ncbi:permease [Megasphaera cerevisiae]|uniref:permease n=1 Tax=Megasphaera cerevisiae TaxID=39029 RepID=UPI0009439B38|nr:permease [Megasphaera cerevisiae]OKY54709.1 hypothetical protein BSR42_01335 [Megasphaera cerevisiae]